MPTVQTRPIMGLSAQFALLAMLASTVGLSGFGWIVGMACGAVTNEALARGLARHGALGLGPADRVTLGRATLAGGVAALTADSFWRPSLVTTLVALTIVALVLDAVDGWVARRTGTVSALGARFDMEVDALLILVLSVYVASSIGAWVLAIGAARYAFVAATRVLPWLRAPMPTRYWGKVVAATQGVVLTVAAAEVMPRYAVIAALAAALVMLAESFGSQVWWLWLHRPIASGSLVASPVVRVRRARVGQLAAAGARHV